MKKQHLLIALAGSLALTCAFALAAPGKGPTRYRFIDKEGVVHLSDTIPPEYADQGHQELNDQGVPIRDFPRQLSPAEAETARKKKEEQDKRDVRDSFLRNNFTKVSDIEQLRDERIAQIDSQMELARSSIATTGQRLIGLQTRLGAFRPYSAAPNARRIPDQLVEEVVRALSERRSMSTQLQQREKEKAEQLASFEADIARYKELKPSSLQH